MTTTLVNLSLYKIVSTTRPLFALTRPNYELIWLVISYLGSQDFLFGLDDLCKTAEKIKLNEQLANNRFAVFFL